MKISCFLARGLVRRMLPVLLLGSIVVDATAQPVRVPERFRPPTSWADLADAVAPAVVTIDTVTIERREARAAAESKGAATPPPEGDAEGDPFEFFFPDEAKKSRGTPGEKRTDGRGTGFLVSRDGLIITNHHVVDGADEVKVLVDGRHHAARVRGVDTFTDIALLQIDTGQSLPYLELTDSDVARVGDWVMVIGNPLALDKTVTTGVVSAKGREIGITGNSAFEDFIQTDAAINFGNSGGPMIDMQGHVLGVATAINYGAQGIGFAVPANLVRDILPQLRDKGRVSRGYLGAQATNLDLDAARALGVEGRGWVRLGDIAEGSAAQKARLKPGDVVLSIDGKPLRAAREFTFYVAAKAPGTDVTLELVREGKTISTQATLGERPEVPPESTKARTPRQGQSKD